MTYLILMFPCFSIAVVALLTLDGRWEVKHLSETCQNTEVVKAGEEQGQGQEDYLVFFCFKSFIFDEANKPLVFLCCMSYLCHLMYPCSSFNSISSTVQW
jgi:hypothetical protein